MKFIIDKKEKSKIPSTKVFDLGAVLTDVDDLLTSSTLRIDQNTIPVIYIDGVNYLINNFNPGNYKEDFEILLAESDLITFGNSTGGDFVPLTGTTEGNPVTGDIIVSDAISIKTALGSAESFYIGDLEKGAINFSDSNTNPVDIYGGETSRGISSSVDFTQNITDLDYTQKKYVDQKVADSRPYKVYTALLTQSGTDAPVATVLENTLGGTPIWSYDSLGYYLLTGTNLFNGNIVVKIGIEGITDFYGTSFTDDYTSNEVNLFTSSLTDIGTGTNGLLKKTSIEIKVYN